ncbi:hypothetical protein [Shinella sedimenti]|uniref:Uncharacterized protein n=1 Tax=Shinella sedimenti TaxID=2919913 RepID=A0ABT0CT32_9HYPH|nr:hypothetical protein [Shinella sedimenti]MCJ8151771.1 hypothetical protein [Shinella sedimenti]
MSGVRFLLTGLIMLCIAAPLRATEIEPINGRFSVGRTGIMCTTQPCPWLGIVELDNPGHDPLRPLWANVEMPKLRASHEDAARIAAAWEAHECLVVDGSFYTDAADIEGLPVLRVRSIIGNCP